MKKTIRKAVFETNSSSTHSLTLESSNCKCSNKTSFVIKTPLAKIVWLLCMIGNAENKKDISVIDLHASDRVITSRDKILKFKDILISEYCNMQNITLKQATERFKQQNLEFKKIYKKGTNASEFSCRNFFFEGPFDDCDCGFESYMMIEYSLKLDLKDTTLFAKEFLTDSYQIIGSECAYGSYWQSNNTY